LHIFNIYACIYSFKGKGERGGGGRELEMRTFLSKKKMRRKGGKKEI